jgi:hypothetical protein
MEGGWDRGTQKLKQRAERRLLRQRIKIDIWVWLTKSAKAKKFCWNIDFVLRWFDAGLDRCVVMNEVKSFEGKNSLLGLDFLSRSYYTSAN